MKSSEPLLKMYLLVMALFLAPGIMSSNIALDGTLSANEWDGSLSFDLEYEIMPSLPSSCANNRTVHLIRHAEGWHNVDELTAEREQLHLKDPKHTQLREEFGIAWMLLERVSGRKYHDPRLTPKGREQAYALRTTLRQEDNFSIDAVALSPIAA